MTDVDLRAELVAEPAQVGAARQMLRGCLADAGIDGDLQELAVLLVSELVTNAILHASPPIRLFAQCDGDRVRVEVHDGDGSSAPTLRRAHDELSGGSSSSHGRGLRLVDELSTRWGSTLSEAGKLVWFELDVPLRAV